MLRIQNKNLKNPKQKDIFLHLEPGERDQFDLGDQRESRFIISNADTETNRPLSRSVAAHHPFETTARGRRVLLSVLRC